MIIVENNRTNLKSMKDIEHLNYSIQEHMKKIKKYSEGLKIMKLFQLMSEYSVKATGMSFMNNKTMANKLDVSVRTIQRYTKKLEELKIILKVPTYRERNNSQTSNTYVILPVIKKVCHGVCHTKNPSLNLLKQESNINISNQLENEFDNKVVQYVVNRINDSRKKGTIIDSLSSYVDRVVRSLERQALLHEELKQSKAKSERQQQESLKKIEDIRNVLFDKNGNLYNWLDN